MQAISISSPIEEKIAWAETCYEQFREQFREDAIISELVEKLKRAIHASRSKLIASGIVEVCGECERDEGGSCCGAGMEDRYDGWMLCINRLLGVELPGKRKKSESCFFLGDTGCGLSARQVICINYICKKITDRIDFADINALREEEGREIRLLFLLHEQLKNFVRRRTG